MIPILRAQLKSKYFIFMGHLQNFSHLKILNMLLDTKNAKLENLLSFRRMSTHSVMHF